MKAVLKTFGDAMQSFAKRKSALATTPGAQGGYTVPTELVMAIDDRFHEQSIFGTYAWQQPMGTKVTVVPALDITATHATGDSPMVGGVTCTWFDENQAVTESEPSLSACVLQARNLGVNVYVSNQLVADGGEALGVFLTNAISYAVAFTVDRQCFVGTGLKTPLGVINAPAAKNVTRAGAGHITQADIANLVASLLPACFMRSFFCGSVSALADIANLSTYMANRNSDINAGSALCGTLFGRPLMITEKLPALGTRGDLILIDPKLYVLGTRGVYLDQSTHVRFFNNQTVFRFIWRGDGQPLVKGTATLADGVTTAAAFVILN